VAEELARLLEREERRWADSESNREPKLIKSLFPVDELLMNADES